MVEGYARVFKRNSQFTDLFSYRRRGFSAQFRVGVARRFLKPWRHLISKIENWHPKTNKKTNKNSRNNKYKEITLEQIFF